MQNKLSPIETCQKTQPRLRLTYRLEFETGVIERELPFVIGILADISGNSHPPLPKLRNRKWIEIHRENFENVLAAAAPGLCFEVADVLGAGHDRLPVSLRFRRMSDFNPEAMVDQSPALREQFNSRTQRSGGRLYPKLAAMDRRISDQLDLTLHAPEFQKLESTWRSLHYLVFQTEASDNLRIRILDVKREELRKDLHLYCFMEEDSQIFKKIYEEEFGIFGGRPYGLLIGDYEFGPEPQDIEFLDRMSFVAAASYAPFITAASPGMFGCRDFCDIPDSGELACKFEGEAYARWRSFRESGDASYAGLVIPRVLLRPPYIEHPIGEFRYNEKADDPRMGGRLQGNSAYVFAAMAANTHAAEGWCASLGIGKCGIIRNETDAIRLVPEVRLNQAAASELAGLGFIPLVQSVDSESAVFVDPRSCAAPARENATDATPGGVRSGQARLRYILAVSRFAHYIKCIIRETRGCFTSPEERAGFLNSWIQQYVMPDAAGLEPSEFHPLQRARVAVHHLEYVGPGWYEAVVDLTPCLPSESPSEEICLPAEVRMRWRDL